MRDFIFQLQVLVLFSVLGILFHLPSNYGTTFLVALLRKLRFRSFSLILMPLC